MKTKWNMTWDFISYSHMYTYQTRSEGTENKGMEDKLKNDESE